jgi:hypothetical protein
MQLLTSGRPNAALWYASENDVQFAKTSVGERLQFRSDCELGIDEPPDLASCPLQVTNGFDAAYNYVRDSKSLPASDDTVTELVQSQLLVRLASRSPPSCFIYTSFIFWLSLFVGARV